MMENKNIYSEQSRRGFTLIELLIVIAIIAILAVVIILNVASARTKAQDARIKDDLTEVWKAFQIYKTYGGELVDLQDFDDDGIMGDKDVQQLKDEDGVSIIGVAPRNPLESQYGQYYWYYWGTFYFGFGTKLSDDSTEYACQTSEQVPPFYVFTHLGETTTEGCDAY